MKPLKMQERYTEIDSISFKRYLSDIYKIKQFTNTEEEDCCKLVESGDKKALDELVSRNLRFVISVAKQYETQENKLDDLINEGNYGLVIAAQRYRLNSGFKFITYAVWYIRKYIMEYVTTHSRTVRLPSNKVGGIMKLNNIINEIEHELGRTPDVEEIIQHIDSPTLNSVDIYELHRLSKQSCTSLDADFDTNCESNLYDILPNTTQTIESLLFVEDTGLVELLKNLSPKERHIISHLYGLNGKPIMKMDEIAKEMQVYRGTIANLKEQGLKKLKRRFVFN